MADASRGAHASETHSSPFLRSSRHVLSGSLGSPGSPLRRSHAPFHSACGTQPTGTAAPLKQGERRPGAEEEEPAAEGEDMAADGGDSLNHAAEKVLLQAQLAESIMGAESLRMELAEARAEIDRLQEALASQAASHAASQGAAGQMADGAANKENVGHSAAHALLQLESRASKVLAAGAHCGLPALEVVSNELVALDKLSRRIADEMRARPLRRARSELTRDEREAPAAGSIDTTSTSTSGARTSMSRRVAAIRSVEQLARHRSWPSPTDFDADVTSVRICERTSPRYPLSDAEATEGADAAATSGAATGHDGSPLDSPSRSQSTSPLERLGRALGLSA